MAKVRLGDVAPIVQGKAKRNLKSIWLLNLDMVESETGNIIEHQYVSPNKIGTSTCQFDTDNVLYSKLRPYLNKVVLPDREGFATSEMLPLKPDTTKLQREYLTYFLRSPSFVNYITDKVAGAKMPRARTEDLKNAKLHLPSLSQQKAIVNILDIVTSLISLRKQQLSKLDDLVKASFVEMFGDLALNPYQWPEKPLVYVCRCADDIKCGPFGTQLGKYEYQTEGIPLLGIPQINSFFARPVTDYLSQDKAKELGAYSLISGDIAMSRKGNVGMCALYPDSFSPGIIHSDVLRIRVDKRKANPCFIMYQLHISPVVGTQIGMVSSGAIMAGINVSKLKNITVHFPPFDLQVSFAGFVERVNKMKLEAKKSLEKLEMLKRALMQHYFEDTIDQ